MEKEKKIKLSLFIVAVIIGIALVLVGLYLLFFKKDDKTDNNQLPPTEVVDTTEIELNIDEETKEVAKIIQLGNNSYEFKFVLNEGENEIYLNDEKIETTEYSSIVVYLVDRYLIVGIPKAKVGSLALGYVNETGHYEKINKKIYNIYYESGFMYGSVEVSNNEAFKTKVVKITFATPSNVIIEDVK